MSTSKPTTIEDSGGIASELSTFVARVTEALESTDADDELVSAVEDQGDQLVNAVEDELTSIEDDFNETTEQIENNDARMKYVVEDIVTLETDVEDIESRVDRLEEDETPTPSDDHEPTHDAETTLETVVSLPEHVADEELTSNQKRARFIARDVRQYGAKTPRGYRVTSSDIRKAISASEDGATVHQQTVSRIIDFLDDLGGEDTTVRKKNGKRRVVFTDDALVRYARAKQRNVEPVTLSVTG